MLKVIMTLDLDQQRKVLEAVRDVLDVAPSFEKFMPKVGTPFNYRCTSAGQYGWYADKDGGYRYEERHPVTGDPFPAIPPDIMGVIDEAKALAGEPEFRPESCLINIYSPTSTLGIHQDKTEKTLKPMVLSISLGASMDFLWCMPKEGYNGKKHVIRIKSGDVLVMSGEHRLCWHGVPKKPIAGTEPADLKIKKGYRVNLTVRQVNP